MSVSHELLAQLEQDADNLYKRFNQYLPSSTCQEPPRLRQPLQPLSNHENSSRPSSITSTRPATSGRQMAENIVTSLEQELAADASSQSVDAASSDSLPPQQLRSSVRRSRAGRNKPPTHSSSSHSAPAATSSRLNISSGSSSIIAEVLSNHRRAVKPSADCPASPARTQTASAEALAVACAAAALGTEHRVSFLAETLREHPHEQARVEALKLLKKMGAAAAGAATAVHGVLELYHGLDPEFVALCAEVIATIGQSAAEQAAGTLMRIARDRSFSQRTGCTVHAAAAGALGHCSVHVITKLVEVAGEVAGAHGAQLLEGLLNSGPIMRTVVVPLLLREASGHADGSQREAAMGGLALVRTGLLELVPGLIELLVGGHVCRDTCCSVLRAQGNEGEQVLLALALRNPLERVRLACIRSLGQLPGVLVDQPELVVKVDWAAPYTTHDSQITLSDSGVLRVDGQHMCTALMALHPSSLDRTASSSHRRLPEASVSNDVCSALRSLQQDPSAALRSAAVAAVAELVVAEQLDGRDQLVLDTLHLLSDPDARVREQAALAAGHIGEQLEGSHLASMLKVLPGLLRDDRPKVRRSCCFALQQIGPPAAAIALPALSKALLDGSTNRDELANTIAALGPSGEQLLLKRLNTTGATPVRVACAQALAAAIHSLESPHMAADAMVHLACTDPSPNARRAAVRLLGELGANPAKIAQLQPRRLWPLLYSLLSDKSAGLAEAAAQALGECGGRELLIAAVQRDECCRIRAAACAGLMELQCGAVLHALLVTLNDREPKVRCAAGEALLTIGVQQALNTMAEVLAEEEQGAHPQEGQLVWHTLQELLQSPYPQTAPLKAFLMSLEKGLERYELDLA